MQTCVEIKILWPWRLLLTWFAISMEYHRWWKELHKGFSFYHCKHCILTHSQFSGRNCLFRVRKRNRKSRSSLKGARRLLCSRSWYWVVSKWFFDICCIGLSGKVWGLSWTTCVVCSFCLCPDIFFLLAQLQENGREIVNMENPENDESKTGGFKTWKWLYPGRRNHGMERKLWIWEKNPKTPRSLASAGALPTHARWRSAKGWWQCLTTW